MMQQQWKRFDGFLAAHQAEIVAYSYVVAAICMALLFGGFLGWDADGAHAQISSINLNVDDADVVAMTSMGSDAFTDLWPLMLPAFGLAFAGGLIALAKRARR